MRSRPKRLMLYTLALLGVAISLPVQIYVLYGHTWNELDLVLAKFSITNWALLVTLPALAWSAWNVSPHFKWLAPLSVALTALNNSFVAQYGTDYTPMMVHTGSIAFGLFALSPYFSNAYRDILANPGKRWWRTDERHSFTQPVTVFVNGRLLTEAISFDISSGGIFLHSEDRNYYGLLEGDQVSVRWLSPQAEAVEIDAKVVRTTEGQGQYPRGIGVQFENKAPSEAYM